MWRRRWKVARRTGWGYVLALTTVAASVLFAVALPEVGERAPFLVTLAAVFVTSSYGVGCNCFRIRKSGGQFTAQQIYSNTQMQNHHGGVILVGDHLYGHSDGSGWVSSK